MHVGTEQPDIYANQSYIAFEILQFSHLALHGLAITAPFDQPDLSYNVINETEDNPKYESWNDKAFHLNSPYKSE